MKNHFNIVEYIKLLEKEKILATKGYSLYSENEEENNRLRSYRITLEDQIYYNNRYEYQFLIKGYISEKMSTLAFISEIFEDCDYSFDENCKVTEEEFKDCIKKKYSQIQKYF